MLTELCVTNYALLEEVRLELGPGLTVLSGETGVGKSILVEALSALLGERVGPEAVRTGCRQARIDAVFEPSAASPVMEALDNAGRPSTDGRFLLSRRLRSDGHSRSYLNDSRVSLSLVRRLGDHLVDFHGQHTHQLLLRPPEHLMFLDAYGGLDVLRGRVAELAQRESDLSHRLVRLQEQSRDARARSEFLEFQVRELEALGLKEGEEDAIHQELRMRESAERLAEAAARIQSCLYDADDSIVERLKEVQKLLAEMNAAGAKLDDDRESVASAAYRLEDVAHNVRRVADRIDDSPERLETLRERMSALQGLKRRYGTDDLLGVLQKFRTELTALEAVGDGVRDARKARGEVLAELKPLAKELSARRREVAAAFSRHVERELRALAMHRAEVGVQFSATPDESAWEAGYPGDLTGLETVEFLLSANPGEDARPLARVASGGEISRIMLAMKAAIRQDRVGTMVFDEIDVGIGGETADLVGKKLLEVSGRVQVLCVTHLARIACRADTHYHVLKRSRGGRTVTHIQRLRGEQRVREIARMLSGEATSASLAHARELLGLQDGTPSEGA